MPQNLGIAYTLTPDPHTCVTCAQVSIINIFQCQIFLWSMFTSKQYLLPFIAMIKMCYE